MEMPDAETVKAPATRNDTSSSWAFLKDNFAVLSGMAVLGGLALAIIFLAAYLSVFDWHLIAFVQYVDVISFGVIAVAAISGSFTMALCVIQYFAYLPKESPKFRKYRWITDGTITLALVGFLIWSSIRTHHGYLHIVAGTLLLGGIGFVTVRFTRHFGSQERPTVIQILYYMVLAFSLTGLCGLWMGYSVLETPEAVQDVRSKDLTLESAKVVIVMSRFTVLLKDKTLYVVPTSDITQFRTSHPLINILPSPAQ